MSDIITECLGTRWAMFYVPEIPARDLVSSQTLEGSISTVNTALDQLGPNITSWEFGLKDEAGRLLWVNWIYQHLNQEPIKKPILTHYQDHRFYVDCGDTRLMSARLRDPNVKVPMITTCALDQAKEFSSWDQIHTSDDLRRLTNFSPDACVLATPAEDWCFYWLEIGDQTTEHHLHNLEQRAGMLTRYLEQQPKIFKFSLDWVTMPIDWATYQDLRDNHNDD